MAFVWDYDTRELQKTEPGRIKLLERAINFGPEPGEKIKLMEVKKYWNRLQLFPLKERLYQLLLWGKYRSLTPNKKLF